MVQSPVIQEIIAESQLETKRKAIVKVLHARFGDAGEAVRSEIEATTEPKLDDLLELAATCRSLASFRKKLSS
jgi:hypothetical protein